MKLTNTPKLRFKEFTDKWQEKKLSDVTKFFKGRNISKDDVKEGGTTNCIRYGELYTVYKEIILEVKSKTNLDPKKLFLSKKNDVIIPASGETNIDIATASCVLKDDIALGGDLNVIRTEQNGIFLSYYLNNSKRIAIAKLAQGQSVVHLYSFQLKDLILNLPSVEEQQKIADFLTTVDEKISHLEAKKSRFEKYIKGAMQAIFSQKTRFKKLDGSNYPDWEEKKLGEIFEISSCISKSNTIETDGKYVIVDMGSISADYRLLETKKTNIENDLLARGDLVMAKDDIGGGNIIGKVIFVPEDHKYICGDHVYKMKAINGLPKFLYYVINSSRINKIFRQKANGTAQLGLGKKSVFEQTIPFPSTTEQEKIAEFLTSLDNKVDLINKELEQARLFKKALLQQMFA